LLSDKALRKKRAIKKEKSVPGNGNEVQLDRGPYLNMAWKKWRVNIWESIKPWYRENNKSHQKWFWLLH
jgi:hypothetical protein